MSNEENIEQDVQPEPPEAVAIGVDKSIRDALDTHLMSNEENIEQDAQPEPPEATQQLTIFDELQYAYDGLLACLRADDLLRATMFAGILIQTASTLQVRACRHLVSQMPSKAILPGLHEEFIISAGMEGIVDG